ncbi:MAG: hypothetical protein QOJ90_2830 [Actinomycetota bacterium]|jgi:hypothetical protein|nr:hypothetical protein [Actinomycetota bacterium]
MTARSGAATPLTVLSRIRAGRPEPSPYERCEMCAAPVADEHQHVVNVASRSLLCTCRACYLLFTHDDATLAYRAVPDRFLVFPDLAVPVWDELELPVGTAFLFVNSALGRVVAFYPGPAGATESELPLAAWDRLAAGVPGLAALRPDVEALLVRSTEQKVEAFLVPIDVCYELVGHLRMLWRGFDGGQDVRRRLAEFFDQVRAKSRPVSAP